MTTPSKTPIDTSDLYKILWNLQKPRTKQQTIYRQRATGTNQWTGSSDNFQPLTRAEALQWCEEHEIDSATIDANFADLLTDA